MIEKFITTNELKIAYEVGGPTDGKPVVLVHGWPDCARTWDGILPILHQAGYQTFVPSLRGFGKTEFLNTQTRRTGGFLAFADDLRQFIEALNLGPVRIIGQDWGAQTALVLSSLFGEQYVKAEIVLSEGWKSYDNLTITQIQNYWYQWYMITVQGEHYVRQNKAEFTLHMWQEWSPKYEMDPQAQNELLQFFQNSDWSDVTLNTYRERWGYAPFDGKYADMKERLDKVKKISVPTLNILGKDDTCTDYRMNQNMSQYFDKGFKQEIWSGTGHFIQREAPKRLGTIAAKYFENQL
ncbi:alpha/beta fold hydrolase [Companilactobacillus kimchiensis]|uniref:Alpha beta hydrolase fold protein n=1 Tax=Companilactobacillus kimchiensis TaxID=993692 RepID=A0A0R2LBY9_9LACO|nr:alpha/beta hydrolase [Companilactobacillus kimchiensis]KRN99352.1 alpha beta hydrolase fold protein [Companilactobacillus kimchiensis]